MMDGEALTQAETVAAAATAAHQQEDQIATAAWINRRAAQTQAAVLTQVLETQRDAAVFGYSPDMIRWAADHGPAFAAKISLVVWTELQREFLQPLADPPPPNAV